MTNTSWLNVVRAGYTPTKDWGTTKTGGTILNQYTKGTGKELAAALGKQLTTSDISISVYAQWVQTGIPIYYDFWKSPTDSMLGLKIFSSDYEFVSDAGYESYKRIREKGSSSTKGSAIDMVIKSDSAQHRILHPSSFGVYCPGYTFRTYEFTAPSGAYI
jgi:hypothetical protein